MSKLDRAKKVISEHLYDAGCGIFNTRNFAGDAMTTIYEDDDLTIDICYHWEYLEVFGLTDEEFNELEKFYKSKRGW